MPDKNLTNNEIVKALECWQEFDTEIDDMLMRRFKGDKSLLEQKEVVSITFKIFDLINRQKAEIERLRDMVSQNEGVLPKYEQLLKSEARKEFAERLKGKGCNLEETGGFLLEAEDIDNLLIEMEREKDA